MAVPTTIVNLAMTTGEDKVFQDTIYQADGVTRQNIAGWGGAFTVHAYNDPTTVYISKTTAAGMVPTDPTSVGYNTAWNITVARADTVTMDPGEYEYLIERTDAGNAAVVTRGLFTLLRR